MRIAADPSNADPLIFEIFRSFDVGFAKETMSQNVFHAADKDDIGSALNEARTLPIPPVSAISASPPRGCRRRNCG